MERHALQCHRASHQRIVQQRGEAFPADRAPTNSILDRDGKFSGDVARMQECPGGKQVRTAYPSPWQDGMAKRKVGSSRRNSSARAPSSCRQGRGRVAGETAPFSRAAYS
jgi:hypothetical protein